MKVAIKDLTFHVRPGEVFGFLGPNGAGKTTKVVAELVLGALAHLEEQVQNTNEPVRWLERPKKVSTTPLAVQQGINELRAQKHP
jgi:ABC-2 type transport system ATP-binding protein